MGMNLMREDVQKGVTKKVAGYDGITLAIGNYFIDNAAEFMATRIGGKTEISNDPHPDDPNRVRHVAVVEKDNEVVFRYYGEWI